MPKPRAHENRKGTVWGYFVVSSAKQADTLEDQEYYFDQSVAENGWEVTDRFKDVSSGKDGTRELLDNLLIRLKETESSQRPEFVWMKRADRLGRGIGLEAIEALAKIHAMGVTVYTLQDGGYALNSPTDLLKPIIRIVSGAIDNETKNLNLRVKNKQKRERGQYVGRTPYGIQLVNGYAQPMEPQASIVRKVFEWRAQGKGTFGIARETFKIAPPGVRSDGSPLTYVWGKSTIQQMIRCRTYRGVVVPDELWDAAQGIKNPRVSHYNTPAIHPWPLRGVLRCFCGRMLGSQPIHRMRKTKGHGVWRYYLCVSNVHTGPKKPWFNAEKLEAQFAEYLAAARLDTELQARMAQGPLADPFDAQRARLKALRDKEATIERRKRSAWDLQADGGMNGPELKARLAELAAEAAGLASEIGALEDSIMSHGKYEQIARDAAKALRTVTESWGNLDPLNQRRVGALFALACGGLYVTKDRTIVRVDQLDNDDDGGDDDGPGPSAQPRIGCGREEKQSRSFPIRVLANLAEVEIPMGRSPRENAAPVTP